MELLPAVDRRIICKHFEKTSTSNKKHIPTSHNINKNTTSQLHTSLDKRYETVLDMSGARDCSKHTSAAGPRGLHGRLQAIGFSCADDSVCSAFKT